MKWSNNIQCNYTIMKKFNIKCLAGVWVLTVLLFTACGKKSQNGEDTGSYNNESTDNTRVDNIDTASASNPDTVYNHPSDSMYNSK